MYGCNWDKRKLPCNGFSELLTSPTIVSMQRPFKKSSIKLFISKNFNGAGANCVDVLLGAVWILYCSLSRKCGSSRSVRHPGQVSPRSGLHIWNDNSLCSSLTPKSPGRWTNHDMMGCAWTYRSELASTSWRDKMANRLGRQQYVISKMDMCFR